MLQRVLGLIGFLSPCAALAQAPAPAPGLHASYDTYAAGMRIAEVDTGLSLGPRNYRMTLAYRSTGMVGMFVSGHQSASVDGAWRGEHAAPSHFIGQGQWGGDQRVSEIEYRDGRPIIRQLLPPNDAKDQEPVPDAIQANTIDGLSALAEIIHVVKDTGRCETTMHTYDGRRAYEIDAHTGGEQQLEPTSRSSFAGNALRCDFTGRMLAGFKPDEDRTRASRPLHGSAWLAPAVPGAPPLPVRMAFETRWFGDVIMYLTDFGPGSDLKVARQN